jgi:hypothetical protein
MILKIFKGWVGCLQHCSHGSIGDDGARFEGSTK